MIMKKILSVVIVLTLVITLFNVDVVKVDAAKKVKVSKVGIIKPYTGTLVIKKGETYKIKTTVTPSKATNKKLIYKSSKVKNVSVSSTGVLKALKKGTSKITVSAKDGSKKSAKLKVIVGTPVTDLTMRTSKSILTVGEKFNFVAKLSPEKPSITAIKWTSSNKKVATINSKGMVTAKEAGTTSIRAIVNDGIEKSVSCKVTVCKSVTPTESTDPTGTPQPTGFFDFMINGNAFFILSSNGVNYFTKSGAMDIDAQGTLYCKTNGAIVMGWQLDKNGEILKSQISPLRILDPKNLNLKPEATTEIALYGNIDKNDLMVQFAPNAVGYPISINFFDKLGENHSAKFSIVQDAIITSKYTIAISDIINSLGKSLLKRYDESVQEYISLDYKFKFDGVDVLYNVEPTTGVITMTDGEAKLKFNVALGKFESISKDISKPGLLNLNLNPDADEVDITFPDTGVNIDFSTLTMYDAKGISNVKSRRGDISSGDGAGYTAGKLYEILVNTDGRIYGSYTNGEKILLGKIAVAIFPNPSGLKAIGNNMFVDTISSGFFDGIGQDVELIGSITKME